MASLGGITEEGQGEGRERERERTHPSNTSLAKGMGQRGETEGNVRIFFPRTYPKSKGRNEDTPWKKMGNGLLPTRRLLSGWTGQRGTTILSCFLLLLLLFLLLLPILVLHRHVAFPSVAPPSPTAVLSAAAYTPDAIRSVRRSSLDVCPSLPPLPPPSYAPR